MATKYISFLKRFKRPILDRTKVCTIRPNDFFQTGDEVIALSGGSAFAKLEGISVENVRLGEVPTNPDLLRKEGVRDGADFINTWRSIHTRKGWTPNLVQRLHTFELIEAIPDGASNE